MPVGPCPGKRDVSVSTSLLLLVLLLGAGPALAKKKRAPATSPTVSFATYKEEVGRITVVLGTQIASIDPATPFLPFQIAVGVYGPGEDLVVTRASFALITPGGRVYTAAPLRDVVEGGKISYFRQAARLNPLHDGNTFDKFHRIPADFYPQTAGPLGKEYIEMTRDTYFEDILYFPRPESGLDGVLTLQFVARGLREPLRLRFEVPIRDAERTAQPQGAGR